MSWLSGKPIDSQLGGARFKSLLALFLYICIYTLGFLSCIYTENLYDTMCRDQPIQLTRPVQPDPDPIQFPHAV